MPDRTVLARFRQKHEESLTGMLTEALVLTAKLGVVSLGVVALEGTEIAANASEDANRSVATFRKLAQDYVGRVADADAKEDTLFGADARGDELPEAVPDRTDRGGRIQRALDEIDARRAQAAAEVKKSVERARAQGLVAGAVRRGRAPNGAYLVVVTQVRWQRARDAAGMASMSEHVPAVSTGGVSRRPVAMSTAGSAGRGRLTRTRWPTPPRAPMLLIRAPVRTSRRAPPRTWPMPAPRKTQNSSDSEWRAHLTDPDSRLLKTRGGWVQRMKCQTSTSDDVFILDARATQDANNVGQFLPTNETVQARMAQVEGCTGRGVLTQIGVMIADAGPDSADHLTAEGPARLIADSKGRHIEARAATELAAGPPPGGHGP